MKQVRAIIFDLDGTLVDGEKGILGAYKHVFEMFNQPYDEEKIRTYIGRTLEHSYGEMIPGHDPVKLSSLHRKWQLERIHLVESFNGLTNVLENLSKRDIKLGVFTSSSRRRTDAILHALGLGKYFEVVLCGDEVTNPKPHHEGVVMVAKELKVDLENVVMVGDSKHDIHSGKSAGVVTVGITHGFGTQESLHQAGADYMVKNLKELQKLLQKLVI